MVQKRKAISKVKRGDKIVFVKDNGEENVHYVEDQATKSRIGTACGAYWLNSDPHLRKVAKNTNVTCGNCRRTDLYLSGLHC